MTWWVPLAVSAAQMAKQEYDKQQAEKKAMGSLSSSGGGFSAPVFDASKFDQQDITPIRDVEYRPAAPTSTPYYQPQIGGDIDSRLQQLRMLEAEGGMYRTPLPSQPEIAPQWYNPYLERGYGSVIRGR